MKIVDREELRRLPVGAIFQEWRPCRLGRLQRFEGACDEDFLASDVGPWVCLAGYNQDQEDNRLVIGCDSGREGLFDPSLRYLVLEQDDVEAVVRQLRGADVVERHLSLGAF